MGIIGTLPGDRLAGLLIDQIEKIRKGALTLDELALFTQRKNPFGDTLSPISRNQHGHFVATITGLNLTGAEEIARLEAAGYRISEYAKSVLLSVGTDGYDKKHRLIAGQTYQVAIMPGNVIVKNRDGTTANLRKEALRFGYEKPQAGIMPRIRELVSGEQLKEMGFSYITGLHDTILDSDGDPNVLIADRDDGGRWLYAYWVKSDDQWVDGGAFAVLVPAI